MMMQFQLNFFILSIFLLSSSLTKAQSDHNALLNGTIAYEKGDYEAAEKDFKKAIDQNSSSLKGNFNLGNSLFKRQKFDEAATHYQNAANAMNDQTQKAQALYNLGNTRLAQAKHGMQKQGNAPATLSEDGRKQLNDAIEAYKGALRNNSNDYDAKNNLAAAYKLMRQQQKQQEKQQQKKDQNKDQDQDQDQNQDQDKNKDQNQDQEQEQDQDQKDNKKPPEDQPVKNDNKEVSGEPEEMKKDAVQRLMEIIEQEDKKVQEKLMKRKRAKTTKPEKAW